MQSEPTKNVTSKSSATLMISLQCCFQSQCESSGEGEGKGRGGASSLAVVGEQLCGVATLIAPHLDEATALAQS